MCTNLDKGHVHNGEPLGKYTSAEPVCFTGIGASQWQHSSALDKFLNPESTEQV